MTKPLADIVEQAIDRVIRSYIPDDPVTVQECDSDLQKVESLLTSAEAGSSVVDLLAHVRATRIFLAAEIGDAESVIRQSDDFLKTFSLSGLDFFNVQILRLRALHVTGSHETEIDEAIATARRPEIRGAEYVSLLENLAARHPESMSCDEQLSTKLQEAIAALNAIGYEIAPPIAGPEMLAETALWVASELRRANRAKGDALLLEEGP